MVTGRLSSSSTASQRRHRIERAGRKRPNRPQPETRSQHCRPWVLSETMATRGTYVARLGLRSEALVHRDVPQALAVALTKPETCAGKALLDQVEVVDIAGT